MTLILHRIEAYDTRVEALCNLALDAVERTAADEEDVARIDLDIFLVGMLATTLRRHVHGGSLEQLQQSLLHAFTADIARNRRIVRLAGDFVDFVDENDAALRCLDIVVGHLQQSAQNRLDILADVACLGENRCIDNRKRHVEQSGDGAGDERFSRTRRTSHNDVRFFDFDIVLDGLLQTFVVVIDGH